MPITTKPDVQKAIKATITEFGKKIPSVRKDANMQGIARYSPEEQYLLAQRNFGPFFNALPQVQWSSIFRSLSNTGLKALYARAYNLAKAFDLSTFPEMRDTNIDPILQLGPDEQEPEKAPLPITIIKASPGMQNGSRSNVTISNLPEVINTIRYSSDVYATLPEPGEDTDNGNTR